MSLESELKAEHRRCVALQAGKKQAEAAKAESEIKLRSQACDMAALRKELTALQATLVSVQHQQQVAVTSCPQDWCKRQLQHGFACLSLGCVCLSI